MEARLAHIAIVAVAAGCTVPPPFHMLETASALPARGVSVMVAGGGGAGEGLRSGCGGAAARVRVGIGGDQEVGVDGSTIFTGNSVSGGFRLGYKRAPWRRLALLAGAGAFFLDGQSSVGADLGAVVSAGEDELPVVPYGGARLSTAIPIDGELYDGGGISETLTIPIGVARRLGAGWQGALEIGGIAMLGRGRFGYTDGTIETRTYLGAYGALAFTWRR
jgi:hypothetical protein